MVSCTGYVCSQIRDSIFDWQWMYVHPRRGVRALGRAGVACGRWGVRACHFRTNGRTRTMDMHL